MLASYFYNLSTIDLLAFSYLIEQNYMQTDWEGGHFPLTLHFDEDYPSRPPHCKFPAGFFHVNVYGSGSVCLSILGDVSFNCVICLRDNISCMPCSKHHLSINFFVYISFTFQAWKPSITVRQILIGIQDLLDNPNPASPAQRVCYVLFTQVFLTVYII